MRGKFQLFIFWAIAQRFWSASVLCLIFFTTTDLWAAHRGGKIKKRQPAPYDFYLKQSQQKFVQLTGVDWISLMTFMESIRQSPGELLQEDHANLPPGLRPTIQNNPCALPVEFTRSAEVRSQWLRCLASKGQKALTPALFNQIWQQRLQIESRPNLNSQDQPAIFLLAWLEDLHREKFLQQGQPSAWYQVDKQKFIGINHFSEFAYEDGDVILDLGQSTVVSTISQITTTPYLASHALIVRKDGNNLSIIQSSVDTGVEEVSWKKFSKSNLSALTVLRLKGFDQNQRTQITRRAAEIAQGFAQQNVPYDFLMDIDDASAVFCNELMIVAYSQAISEITGDEVSARQFSPFASGIGNDSRYQFVQRWGVSRNDMPAPGDLLKSQYLEVVADYRNPQNFLSTWNVVLGGQVLMQRVEEGYQVYPPPYIYPVSWAAKGIAYVLSPFAENAVIPLDYPLDALRAVYTLEKVIKADAIEHVDQMLAKQELRVNVLGVAPWELMAMIQHAVDSKLSIRRWFRK